MAGPEPTGPPERDTSPRTDDQRPTRPQLVDLLEEFLLGQRPHLTSQQVADEVGISMETARLRWRSLGFSAVGDDVPAFTEADIEAMRNTQHLHDLGIVDPEDESALIRTLGRSYARLAEWQIGLLSRTFDVEALSPKELAEVVDDVTPTIEKVQDYVWRRHILNAASRLLLAAPREDEPGEDSQGSKGDSKDKAKDKSKDTSKDTSKNKAKDTSKDESSEESQESREEGEPAGDAVPMAVGFADIVNYTRQSRSLSSIKLARLIDDFEARSLEILTEHGGRIIKTIGDEVLFVADDPAEAALIALELTEECLRDENFPDLRVGLAWGPTLARLGDVYGPVVNVAARLTSTARPGRVLVDRELADQLGDDSRFKLRKLRRTSVKGYRHLEPWALRRPAGDDPALSRDGTLPGPASQFLHQHTKDFFRVVEETQTRRRGGDSDD